MIRLREPSYPGLDGDGRGGNGPGRIGYDLT